MKLVGWMVGFGLVLSCILLAVWQPQARAATGNPADPTGELAVTTVQTPAGEHVVVVDRKQRVMAVYRLNGNGSTIELLSVRDIRWDLMLEDYNPANPRPADVRVMLDQR